MLVCAIIIAVIMILHCLVFHGISKLLAEQLSVVPQADFRAQEKRIYRIMFGAEPAPTPLLRGLCVVLLVLTVAGFLTAWAWFYIVSSYGSSLALAEKSLRFILGYSLAFAACLSLQLASIMIDCNEEGADGDWRMISMSRIRTEFHMILTDAPASHSKLVDNLRLGCRCALLYAIAGALLLCLLPEEMLAWTPIQEWISQ